MVSSTDVPGQYMISWKTGEEDSTSPSSIITAEQAARFARRSSSSRLCSACDGCRQARVKCGGGNPCQRCKGNSLRCHYSISMRNGRLKATRIRQQDNANPNQNSTSTGQTEPDRDLNISRPEPTADWPTLDALNSVSSSEEHAESSHALDLNLSPLFTNDSEYTSLDNIPVRSCIKY